MKPAWDAIGSGFGSRHLRYEVFYSGPQCAIRGNAYRFHDWTGPKAMVQGFRDSGALDRAHAKAAAA